MAAAVALGFEERRASVQYGTIVTEIRGKVAGQVFKGTAAGSVLQNKAAGPGKGSASGKFTKADAGRVIRGNANMADNAGNWRNLSAGEKSAWSTAAPNFPFKNKFGQDYTASGYQLYMSVNQNLLNIGQAVVTTPPTPSDLVPTPVITVAPNMSGDKFEMTGSVPSGYIMTVYASSNMSNGRSFEQGRMKAIKQLPAGTSFPYVLDSYYVDLFGPIPTNGFFWFEAKLTKADAGRQSVPSRANSTT